jgi:hypothetical protein
MNGHDDPDFGPVNTMEHDEQMHLLTMLTEVRWLSQQISQGGLNVTGSRLRSISASIRLGAENIRNAAMLAGIEVK